MIERYFHLRVGHKGGATARVVGDPNDVGSVNVQVARCSKNDPYCKATGRDLASKAPIKVVPLRYLPTELMRLHEEACEVVKVSPWLVADRSYAVRYFLPKQ